MLDVKSDKIKQIGALCNILRFFHLKRALVPDSWRQISKP